MKILVAVDFSEVTERIIDVVKSIPGVTDSEVMLLHVAAPDPDFVGYESGPEVVRDQVAAELRRERNEIHRLGEELRNSGIDTTAIMVAGATVETVFLHAERFEAALIVIGSHGHGSVFDLLFGSISEAIVRESSLPVLVVPAKRY
jgi:nucleotide-binding universal stress UspA family protein